MPSAAPANTGGYRLWLAALAAALLIGALSSVAFVPLIALFAAVALTAAVALRPREAVIALALASPFYDLVVIRIEGVADIRILEILWLVAAVSLFGRVWSGSETRLRTPPRFFTTGLWVLSVWFVVTAAMSGGGLRPFIESSQTVYLCVVAYIVASVVAGMDRADLLRWLRPWAVIMGLVLLASLVSYVLGVDPVARTVVSLPQMSVEYMRNSLLVQNAGSLNVDISRLGILNLGPVGTAAMLVSILAVAFSFTLTDTAPAARRTAYMLLIVGCAVLLLTYSRAGWVLAVAAAGIIILGSNHRRATVALAILTIGLALVASLPSVAPRIEEFTDTGEGSYQAHGRMWVTALAMISEEPVFGWGPGMYAENADRLAIGTWMATDISADQPHNWVLEITAETGVVGGIIAIVFTVWILIWGWLHVRGAPLPAFGVWVAAGCYVAMNLTLNAFRTEMMWVWFGVLIGISAWFSSTGQRTPAEEDSACAS